MELRRDSDITKGILSLLGIISGVCMRTDRTLTALLPGGGPSVGG